MQEAGADYIRTPITRVGRSCIEMKISTEPPCDSRLIVAFVLIGYLLGQSGCSTCIATYEAWPEAYFYGGVRNDFIMIIQDGAGHGTPGRVMSTIIALIDLPFSLIADTLLLPLNISLALRRGKRPEDVGGYDPQPANSCVSVLREEVRERKLEPRHFLELRLAEPQDQGVGRGGFRRDLRAR
jgi:uncharacterized protein YceK